MACSTIQEYRLFGGQAKGALFQGGRFNARLRVQVPEVREKGHACAFHIGLRKEKLQMSQVRQQADGTTDFNFPGEDGEEELNSDSMSWATDFRDVACLGERS